MKSPAPIKVHASSVEMIPLAELAAYEANARTHPEDQIASLVAIIANSGFTNPLLIEDDGTIIAGHGRLEAATRLGMVEVPCVRVSGLSPAQIKALRISDNAVGLRSAWDSDLLALEVAELAEIADFDLGTLGLGGDELDGLLGGPAPLDEMPTIPSEDRQPFQTMTFTLHDDQVATVRAAMSTAGLASAYSGSLNANGNGNALARICEDYQARHGDS